MKRWGYYSGNVDGIYGSQTVNAVKYFQRKNGLTQDGIAGPATLKAMGIYSSSSSSSSTSNSSNVNLLARLIYGEARGEPYTGQVAVGAVVLNRVKSSSFPNTIAGVIYQSGAFDVVSDGQINLTPNSTAKKAAQDALNGWDPSYGAIYYLIHLRLLINGFGLDQWQLQLESIDFASKIKKSSILKVSNNILNKKQEISWSFKIILVFYVYKKLNYW